MSGDGEKKSRPSYACFACKQSHKACDFNTPCKRCARLGHECVRPDPEQVHSKREIRDKSKTVPILSSFGGNFPNPALFQTFTVPYLANSSSAAHAPMFPLGQPYFQTPTAANPGFFPGAFGMPPTTPQYFPMIIPQPFPSPTATLTQPGAAPAPPFQQPLEPSPTATAGSGLSPESLVKPQAVRPLQRVSAFRPFGVTKSDPSDQPQLQPQAAPFFTPHTLQHQPPFSPAVQPAILPSPTLTVGGGASGVLISPPPPPPGSGIGGESPLPLSARTADHHQTTQTFSASHHMMGRDVPYQITAAAADGCTVHDAQPTTFASNGGKLI